MLSEKVLILALSFAYLAVLVHCKDCECQEETCMSTKDEELAEKYVKCTNKDTTKSKCGAKKTKEEHDKCELDTCSICMLGTDAVAEMKAQQCNFLKPEKTPEASRPCCDACLKSLLVCKSNVIAKQAE